MIEQAKEFTAIPGKGIKAVLEDKTVYVGNRRLMEEENIDVKSLEENLSQLEEEGKTAMLVAVDGKVAGIIAVADKIKENSKEAIKN